VFGFSREKNLNLRSLPIFLSFYFQINNKTNINNLPTKKLKKEIKKKIQGWFLAILSYGEGD
jgi:hypothetical protein